MSKNKPIAFENELQIVRGVLASLTPSTRKFWKTNPNEFKRAIESALKRDSDMQAYFEQRTGIVELDSSVTTFRVCERFVLGTKNGAAVKIFKLGNRFTKRFLSPDREIEPRAHAQRFMWRQLNRSLTDCEIVAKLNRGKKKACVVTLRDVYDTLLKNPNGPRGLFAERNTVNVFYVESEVYSKSEGQFAYQNGNGKKVIICAVTVCWAEGGGYRISAQPAENGKPWKKGTRVFHSV